MYVWELVSYRLVNSGWEVWHSTDPRGVGDGPLYHVHLRRPGVSLVATGVTLTEAYAAAARRARDHAETPAAPPAPTLTPTAPHFGRSWAASRN